MAFLGSIFQKFSGGACPREPPRMSHAFGARLHDHSHDAGFATELRGEGNSVCLRGIVCVAGGFKGWG